MNHPLFEFENIFFRYSEKDPLVLKNFSLKIDRGSVTCILGLNGVGKTSLLNLALGWRKPDSGFLRFEGRLLSDYSPRTLGRKLGLVPQKEHIAFEYTVLEYVLLGRAPYLNPLSMPQEEDYQVAENQIQRVGLADKADHQVNLLSGGELQLVLIARSLAQQPELLLLDEPSSHLDLANKAKLVALLKELSNQDVTILMTTHAPEIAIRLSSKLVLMKDGQVYSSGPVAEELTNEKLSAIYGIPIEIKKTNSHQIIVW